MSGSAEMPYVVLVGDETRRLVEAIRVVADIIGQTPTVVGGIAVLCRVVMVAGSSRRRVVAAAWEVSR